MMSEEAKAARRAYKRAWNRANPDKVRAAQARYWERKAKETNAEEVTANDNAPAEILPDTGR